RRGQSGRGGPWDGAEGRAGGDPAGQPRRGDHGGGASLVEDDGQPVGRVRRVEGDVGAAGLQDAEHTDGKARRPSSQQADAPPRPGGRQDPAGQGVGEAVEGGEAEGAAGGRDGGGPPAPGGGGGGARGRGPAPPPAGAPA